MSQATNQHTANRRRFLAIAAGASAIGAGSLGLAAMPAPASQCFLADDSELLQLEKEIFASREAAQVYDDEVFRLSEIWEAELSRLENDRDSTLSPPERWDAVKAMPESAEHTRLVKLQQPHWNRHDAAVERMFSIPATTAEGRAAKAAVILGLMAAFMGSLDEDDETAEYPLNFARLFLVELAGKPGQVRSCVS